MHRMSDPLERALQVAARAPALIDGGETFSFADLHGRCRRLAGALGGLGLERGDRVAILARNSHRFIEAYVGVPAAGFVIVPLNTRHALPELRQVLADSGARVLLTDRDPGPLAAVVERVVRLPEGYEGLLEAAEPSPLDGAASEDSLAGLFYTGGTTGGAKGVMLTHRNLIANTFHWLAAVPQVPDDRFLVAAPLFHAAGSNAVLATLWTCGCQVILEAFDPDHALDLIERHGVTMTLVVPTMLAALAEAQHARPRKVGSLRALAHGGSAIATPVIKRTSNAFPTAEIIALYGVTELSPLVTALRGQQRLVDDPRARSCGRPLAGVDLRILDEAAADVPRGQVGEVVVRGPNVMRGYWNRPEETAAVLRDGRYWTGDLGFMDEDGHVFLVDRRNDMIITGGENVYSTEVEEVLHQHGAVLEAAVFGVPDARWGEAVHAVVVLRAGHVDLDPADLVDFCRGRIAGYKVPKRVEVSASPLPKSGPGKVLKRVLRAPFWAGRERRID